MMPPFFYWLVLLVFSAWMVRPAHSVEQVNPTTPPQYQVNNGSLQSTPLDACWNRVNPSVVQTNSNPIASGTLNYSCGSTASNVWGYCYNAATGSCYSMINYRTAATCPTPASGDPYTFNPTTGKCERPDVPLCPQAGTIYSKGWYNVGTVDSSLPKLHPCAADSCSLLYTGGGVSGSRIISGVRNYFALGAYEYTGEACTPSASNAAPSTFNTLPGSTCAPGQSYIYMNGREKCFDSGTGAEVSTASASAVEAAATKAALDAAAQALTAASAVQAARDAAAAAGGDSSAVQAAGIAAAAQVASDQVKQDQIDTCKDSNKLNCMEAGEVPEAEAIQEKTIDFSTFTFNTYTFSGTASCPAPRVLSLSSGSIPFSYQPFCDFLNVFKFAALAVSMFVAAMIMLGQRSSDTGG